MTRWAILTGEYPPQPGGVADYTRLVAAGLASAGDVVTVFSSACDGICSNEYTQDGDVSVYRLGDHFGPRGLTALGRRLSALQPDRVLIQYVPHAFGWKAMNIAFALWVRTYLTRLAPVWVMFHEVAFPFTVRPLKHALLARVTTAMARTLVASAERIFISIPTWEELLRRDCKLRRAVEWLPVPATIPFDPKPDQINAVRNRYIRDEILLLGHVGTYGAHISVLLLPILVLVAERMPHLSLLLIGRGSREFVARATASHPALTGRIHATGELEAEEVAAHLAACDLLVQPFRDGVSSRRTSVMSGLANGVPMITNLGSVSEPIWQRGGVVAISVPDPIAIAEKTVELLANPAERIELGIRGKQLYQETFALEHTIARLRSAPHEGVRG